MSNWSTIATQSMVLGFILLILFIAMNRNLNRLCGMGKPVMSFYIMFFLAIFIIALSSIIIQQGRENISDSNYNFAVVFLINAILVVVISLFYAFSKKNEIKNQFQNARNTLLHK